MGWKRFEFTLYASALPLPLLSAKILMQNASLNPDYSTDPDLVQRNRSPDGMTLLMKLQNLLSLLLKTIPIRIE